MDLKGMYNFIAENIPKNIPIPSEEQVNQLADQAQASVGHLVNQLPSAEAIQQQTSNVINNSLPKLIALSEKAPSIDTITSNSKDALSFVASSANVAYNNLQNNEQINTAATAIRNAVTSENLQKTFQELLDNVPYEVKVGIVGALVGGAAAPLIVITSILFLGFRPSGIRLGSPAAGWMTTFGGFVPARSFLSGMQSLGARGLPAIIILATITVGAVGGATGGIMLSRIIDSNNTY
ncbi:hypothetical protein CLU79DRAFT_774814 [Phycomyces nitens]|nr:hypothetical protein CLU79DRAFT_774814 [Phycomyces nitens]